MRSGESDGARRLLGEARREFEQCGDPWGLARCWVLTSELPQ